MTKTKSTINGAAAPQEATVEQARPDPEILHKLAEFRHHLQETFAQVVMAMMSTPRYRHTSLNELETLVLDPLLRERIAIAHTRPKAEGDAPEDSAVAGIAIWAKVSPEVDVKIREQIKAGVFPLRLKADDWASGEITWLIDVIAPHQKAATAVLANFQQVAKEGQLFLHPVVRSLVDPELLKRASNAAAPANTDPA